MKHLAFAQTCRICRKSRPLSDFTRPGSTKVNKTCLECLDARRDGREPDVAPPGLSIYLPVTITPEQRRTRRWWPEWVRTESLERLNPRGADEVRECLHCRARYVSKRQQQKFCSKRCKSGWHRPDARAAREARAGGKNVLDTQAKT